MTDSTQPWPATKLVTPDEWHPKPDGVIGVDFETHYTGTYSVATLGVWAYCHDERFDAYVVAVSDGEQTCVCDPALFPWQSITGREWVSHNRDFDRGCFRRLLQDGVVKPGPWPRVWHCSAAASAFLQYGRSLQRAIRGVFGYELDKGVRGKMKAKKEQDDTLLLLGLDKAAGLGDDVLRYAATDAEACLHLWDTIGPKWPQHERDLFNITSNMGAAGLCMNWDYISANREELVALVSSMAGGLPWTPDHPPLSTQQFQKACDQLGVRAPKSTASKDRLFQEWLDNHTHSEAATWVRHMQRIRSANRTEKVLESMETRRMGERMAYELKYFGASTGRWAGAGGLNLQNLNRKECEGVNLRSAIIPPPGHQLAIIDYSQIESRVLLYLAGDTESLDLFREDPNADAYEIHARATMGYTDPRPLDEVDPDLRQLAKARVLGLGFSCGAKKFVEVARIMAGLSLDLDESKRIVEEFRQTNPKITELWQRLHEACASCDPGDYNWPLPCTQYNPALGRYLHYRDVEATEDGIECTVNGERVRIYGGLLAENCLDADTEVLTHRGWVRIVAVKVSDRVFDGEAFVHHHGVVCNGHEPVIEVAGVKMTPDHRVYTRSGWKHARDIRHEAEAYGGVASVRWPAAFNQGPHRGGPRGVSCVAAGIGPARGERCVGDSVQMRGGVRQGYERPHQKLLQAGTGTVQQAVCGQGSPENSWDDQPPGIRCVEVHAGPMLPGESPSIQELRGEGDHRVLGVAAGLLRVLAGYGADLPAGPHPGEGGQRPRIQPTELRVGHHEEAAFKQEDKPQDQDPVGGDASGRGGPAVGPQHVHPPIPTGEWVARGRPVHPPELCATGEEVPVYDLLNCGPRHRFVVRGVAGPILVHNCTQATARDVMASAWIRCIDAGYTPVMSVHDELVFEVEEETAQEDLARLQQIMETPVPWAPALPLRTSGKLCDKYEK